jgi:isocitrate dehydrogenase (NAD+)
VMMLRWLGINAEGDRIHAALLAVYQAGKVRTGDLGGKASTRDFTDAVIERL